MNSSLKILQTGVVGVEPRILFLETSASESEVFSAGFMNLVEAYSEINIQKGDFILIRYDNATKQQMATPDIDVDGIITLIPGTGDVVISGPIEGGLNVGGGDEVFKDVLGNTMRMRTFVAGDNITLTQESETITIDAANAGGVINDGQNLGAGAEVFAQASADNLQFRTIVGGASCTVTQNLNDITIDVTGSGGGTITDGQNLGTGNGIFDSVSGADMLFKSIKAGTNVTVIPDATSLTINATTSGGSGDITDGANVGSGAHVFKQKAGDILQFKTILGGDNVSLSAADNEITINAVGAGFGFDYDNAIWVASNGNDTNNGQSINTPKQTIQAALAALPTGGRIIVSDNGTYTGPFTFSTSYLYSIDAPAAILQVPSGAILTITAGIVNITCNTLDGNVNINSLGYVNLNFNSILGNVNDTSASTGFPRIGLHGTNIEGNITGANRNIFGNVENVTGDIDYFAISNGYFEGAYYLLNEYVKGEKYNQEDSFDTPGWDYVAGLNTSNNQLAIRDTDGIITLPDGYDVPRGYRFTVLHCVRGQNRTKVQVDPETLDDLVGDFSNNHQCWTGPGKQEFIKGPFNQAGGFTWIAAGRVYNSNNQSAYEAIYVSKAQGDDTTGDGTFNSPYATIAYAISVAGTPSNQISIIIIDNETYDENVVIADPNINLIGPTATLAPLTGDAITLSYTAGTAIINLGYLAAPGSNAINITSDIGTLISLTDAIAGDITIAAGTTTLYLSGLALAGDINAGAGVAVNYSVGNRTGSDTGAGTIDGFSPKGTTTDWDVKGTLTASGLNYPTVDGSAGEVIVTDGSGNLSFAPNGGGSGMFPTSIALPLTAFNYYNRWLDTSAELWIQTTSLNGGATSGTLNQDMGTVNVNLTAGVWRITVVAWADNTSGGIINFVFNGSTESLDTYTGAAIMPYSWETNIITDGTYGFQIVNNGKNAGSSGYNMSFANEFIAFTRIGDVP